MGLIKIIKYTSGFWFVFSIVASRRGGTIGSYESIRSFDEELHPFKGSAVKP